MAQHYLLKTFLCDTEKLKAGDLAKVETGAHGVYYAHQEVLPNWVFGESIDFQSAMNLWLMKNSDLQKRKSEFNLAKACSTPLFVYQAHHASAIELTWGLEKFESLRDRLSGKIDNHFFGESKLNLKPHIIP